MTYFRQKILANFGTMKSDAPLVQTRTRWKPLSLVECTVFTVSLMLKVSSGGSNRSNAEDHWALGMSTSCRVLASLTSTFAFRPAPVEKKWTWNHLKVTLHDFCICSKKKTIWIFLVDNGINTSKHKICLKNAWRCKDKPKERIGVRGVVAFDVHTCIFKGIVH